VVFRSFGIALFVKQQRFFKRREQTCEPPGFYTEEIQLSLKLGLDLTNAMTLRAQFANAAKLGQCLEVVNEVGCLRRRRSLDDALLGPAANRLLTETKELFDLLDRVRRFDTLIVCL